MVKRMMHAKDSVHEELSVPPSPDEHIANTATHVAYSYDHAQRSTK